MTGVSGNLIRPELEWKKSQNLGLHVPKHVASVDHWELEWRMLRLVPAWPVNLPLESSCQSFDSSRGIVMLPEGISGWHQVLSHTSTYTGESMPCAVLDFGLIRRPFRPL